MIQEILHLLILFPDLLPYVAGILFWLISIHAIQVIVKRRIWNQRMLKNDVKHRFAIDMAF